MKLGAPLVIGVLLLVVKVGGLAAEAKPNAKPNVPITVQQAKDAFVCELVTLKTVSEINGAYLLNYFAAVQVTTRPAAWTRSLPRAARASCNASHRWCFGNVLEKATPEVTESPAFLASREFLSNSILSRPMNVHSFDGGAGSRELRCTPGGTWVYDDRFVGHAQSIRRKS